MSESVLDMAEAMGGIGLDSLKDDVTVYDQTEW